MTNAKAIVCGAGEGATRIEYLQERGVLRLSGGPVDQGRELSLSAFCEELGIGPAALTPATYFLFAGTKGAPGGGYRDLVGTYSCPTEARREFVTWRRNAACTWAEVVSVSEGRIAALCWFGVDRVDRTLAPRAAVDDPGRRRRRWLRAASGQASSNA